MEREKILTVLRGGGHEKGQNQNKDTYKLLCLNHCSKIPKKTIKLFPKLITETESQKKKRIKKRSKSTSIAQHMSSCTSSMGRDLLGKERAASAAQQEAEHPSAPGC